MKEISKASVEFASIANALIPPTKGQHVGDGIHVDIPDDWDQRIKNGESVPGCTYAKLDVDGDLVISEELAVKLADSAALSKLSASDKASAALMLTKLADIPGTSVSAEVPVEALEPIIKGK